MALVENRRATGTAVFAVGKGTTKFDLCLGISTPSWVIFVSNSFYISFTWDWFFFLHSDSNI